MKTENLPLLFAFINDKLTGKSPSQCVFVIYVYKPVSCFVLQEIRMCQKEPPARVDLALPDQKGATLLPAYVATQGLVRGRPISG